MGSSIGRVLGPDANHQVGAGIGEIGDIHFKPVTAVAKVDVGYSGHQRAFGLPGRECGGGCFRQPDLGGADSTWVSSGVISVPAQMCDGSSGRHADLFSRIDALRSGMLIKIIQWISACGCTSTDYHIRVNTRYEQQGYAY